MKKRKTYHHGDLKAQIAEAALGMLTEGGPETLSIRDISRILGVSPMAPYRHFADKSALLIYLAELGCQELLDRMREVEQKQPDPLRCLEGCARAYVTFANKNRAQFRLIFGPEMIQNEERAQSVLIIAGECIAILVRTIGQAQQIGQIRKDKEAARLADVIWMAIHGYADLLLSGHRESSPEALTLLVDTVLRGIAAPSVL